MRKTAVIIIATLAVMGLIFIYINLQVKSGVTHKRQEDALAISEANVDKGREAKVEGERATVRADKAKVARSKVINQLKGELSGKAASYDDIPLSDSDIGILCRAYRSADPVCQPSGKSD